MSTLTVEEFETLVGTGLDETILQDAIDREEAELAHLIGPLTGERTELLYPGAGWDGPVYLSRFTDAIDEVLDGSDTITTYRLVRNGGAIERSDTRWYDGAVSVTYEPNDLLRVKRALIELVRDAVVPDIDREAGQARDDREELAQARRARLVRALRPSIHHATLRVTDTARVTPVVL